MNTKMNNEIVPEYRTPKVKVMEFDIKGLLCASPGGTIGEMPDDPEIDRD